MPAAPRVLPSLPRRLPPPGWAAVLLLLTACTMPPVVETSQPRRLPGPGTYAWEALPADAAPDIKDSIDQALLQRGYKPRPDAEAAWHVRYETRRQLRTEDLAPDDKMLVPRMVCGLHACNIVHEWTHFGPPMRGNALRTFAEETLQVDIRDARTGELVWRGRLVEEPVPGRSRRAALHDKVQRLLQRLPPARQPPRRAPSPPPAGAAAAPAS